MAAEGYVLTDNLLLDSLAHCCCSVELDQGGVALLLGSNVCYEILRGCESGCLHTPWKETGDSINSHRISLRQVL
jgi:hypothetical protein